MEQGIDRIDALLKAHGSALLFDLHQAGSDLQAEAVVLTDRAWTVCLLAFPTPPERIANLKPIDLAILRVLAEFKNDQLPCRRIHEELNKDRRTRRSESTVKRSLARLMELELVKNARTKRKGYHLARLSSPLFHNSAK